MSRIYIIGTGVIAREHAKVLSIIPDGPHELVVHDTNGHALNDFLKDFPHARAADNIELLFAEAPLENDIVVIATPPSSHAMLACRSLESGRHTLCEKPLAISQAEVDLMFATAERCGRHLGCCSNRFLGYQTTERTKHLRKRGDLGKPYHVTCVQKVRRRRPGIELMPQSRWFLNRVYSGGGPLMDWGVYDLTTLFDVICPMSVCIESAWMSRAVTAADPPPEIIYDIETHFGASLRCMMEDKSIINIDYERSNCTHGEERSFLEMVGTHGAIKWDYLPWIRDSHPQCTFMSDKKGEVHEEVFSFNETSTLGCHARPLYYFHQRLLGEEPLALVDARAKFNISVILGIVKVAQTNQALKVEINRSTSFD